MLNFIFLRNIYFEPINIKFNLYFIDISKKIILDKKTILTNKTNEIQIHKEMIKSENYIYTDSFIGIPIFVSIKNSHISMEHTHPPHLYLMGNDKYKQINKLKKEINEIINK